MPDPHAKHETALNTALDPNMKLKANYQRKQATEEDSKQ
jgi:hypothetical protein